MYTKGNEKWENVIKREQELYNRPNDIRSEFERDYTRIIHCTAYRRMKHKTQVFFNIDNDHICTRMEHVNHVEAVSYTIAAELGLDLELTRAIACGHDIGHAPFGHEGESVLNDLMDEYLSTEYKNSHFDSQKKKFFWHEKNGLHFVDSIELLPDPYGIEKNLNLTYAVRDGIISHCGEVDENGLKPRAECFDLKKFQYPGQFMPCTWEGCVVKISDKIAYLGRDIEDAITLGILPEEAKIQLKEISEKYIERATLNTTSLMHSLIGDICENSSPEKGICLGHKKLELLNLVKDFNYKFIYSSKHFDVYKAYVRLIITSIFKLLFSLYDKKYTILRVRNELGELYPRLTKDFIESLAKRCTHSMVKQNDVALLKRVSNLQNEKIYGGLEDKDIYIQAIIDYISGMTDAYIITIFNELLSFS